MLCVDNVVDGQQRTYWERSQLRHASSLPNLLCSSHSSTNSTSPASVDFNILSLNKSGGYAKKPYHREGGPKDKGSKVEDDYRLVDTSPRVPPRTSESYMYVTPNPIEISAQETSARGGNNLQHLTTHTGTYLTLLGPRGTDTADQEPQPYYAIPSIYDTLT